MTLLNSLPRTERRDIRYPLRLPVSIKTAHKEMRARSENISLGGILLSSAFVIPEGSSVEVAVGVTHLPDPGTLLSARGKVLRVQPRPSGDFALAIQLERSFEVGLQGLAAKSSHGPQPLSIAQKVKTSGYRRPELALAWHTET
jgi:hypothetical protein